MNIFRAYDIRGIYPTELNEEIVERIGKAFGTFNPGKIVVGMDARLSSPSLKKKLIEGLLSTGCKVIDIGMVTTPMLMFSIRRLNVDGGVMVTASHNPKEFNGIKFFLKNAVPIGYESGLKEVEEIVRRKKFKRGNGKLMKKNILQDYSEFLLKKIRLKKKPNLEIVLDAGNGVAGLIYPRIMKKVGVKVFELFCEPDGNFPNHEPNPSKEENLRKLKEEVRESRADLGFAYDGDGDRVMVMNREGKIIRTQTIFSIFIKNALKECPKGKIVYTPLDSKAIEDTILSNGGIPILCKVGHTYITRKMIEEKACLGGEISGHYYFKETYGADDALFASMKLIEVLINSGKKLEDYEKELPKYFSAVSEGLRFPIKRGKKFEFIEELRNDFKRKGFQIDTTDGVKVFFEDGWALFRPSNTESVISCSYEAYSKEGFRKVKKFVDEIIARIPR